MLGLAGAVEEGLKSPEGQLAELCVCLTTDSSGEASCVRFGREPGRCLLSSPSF